MSDCENIIQQAVQVISKYLGQGTGRIYGDYYANKSAQDIVGSVRSILTDLIGVEKAEEEMQVIYQEVKTSHSSV